jgi:HK97 family phage prohead protease
MAFSKYPEAMTNNAKRGLRLNEEVGGKCATAVGKETARILSNKEAISEARTKRMYSFLSRARTYYKPDDTEACGTISYLLWGGDTALNWSESKVKAMKEEEDKRTEELRSQYGDSVELRTAEVRAAGDDALVVEGYASNFDVEYDLGYFKETVARGAFDDVMQDDVRFLLNHTGAPLARTTNGTLELSVDDQGLKYRAALADTQDGRDLYKLIKRGDITQSSFAFTIDSDTWSEDRSTRTITKVGKLLDTSAVTYPASPTASVYARNMAEAAQEVEELKEEQVAAEPVEEKRAEPETIKTEPRNFTQNITKMTLNDLKGQRNANYEEFVAIGQKADSEGRVMTEAEQERCDKLDSLMQDLDVKIKHKTREQDMVARMAQSGTAGASEQREVERVNSSFSLSRAVAAVANGRNLEGAEAEWASEASKEARSQGLQMAGQIAIPSVALRAGAADDFQAGSGDGSGFVPTVVPAAIEALRAPTVLEGLGTTVIRNATGNLQFPRVSNKAVGTDETEVSGDAGSGLEMDDVTLTPQRVAANTKYSKQLILQGGAEVDALIANELAAAMNAYVDDYAFDAIMASTDVDVVNSADLILTQAVANEMEAAVLAAGGNLAGAAYVMSPRAYEFSKTLAQVANVNAVWENGLFNMYRGVATPYLVNSTLDAAAGGSTVGGNMIYGNFQQGGILAYFGGIDILIDQYSNASTAQIALHVNRFFDFGIRQGGALSRATKLSNQAPD